jgi:hypothetical protein
LERAGFVVMKRPAKIGTAALGRGHENWALIFVPIERDTRSIGLFSFLHAIKKTACFIILMHL